MDGHEPLDRLLLRARPAAAAALLLTAFLGAGLRLWQALCIWVPSNDGASYLSMVQDFAHGEFSRGFGYVFPPGTGIVVAPLSALLGDSLLAFSLMGSLAAFFGILALGKAAGRWLNPRAGLMAGLLLSLLSLSVRSVGEAYSESFFVPLLCALLYFQSKGRTMLAGICLGLGFWFRPEGLAMFPLLLAPSAKEERAGGCPWKPMTLALALALLLPLARLAWGLPLFPKFELMRPMGPLGEEGFQGVLLALGANLLKVPGAALEGLDFGLPLLVVPGGLLLFKRSPGLAKALFLAIVLATAAQLLFQVKARFFVDQAPLWILAGTSVLLLQRGVGMLLCLLALLVSGIRVGHDLLQPPRLDKRPELVLGAKLREAGLKQGELLTDMPRVAWAAGLVPPPPLVWTPAKLRAAMKANRPRYIALGARREGRLSFAREISEIYAPSPLPEELSGREGAKRLLLLVRR
ncbi:MAG TPA: hypothetical protein ENK02_04695 [Planctomycetes bacterium]|nr:hypothetical protein [Planctomycetota bacterium]